MDPTRSPYAFLLAAGQRGQAVDVVPVFEPCRVASVAGKGRGLIASRDAAPGDLLHMEPALARGASYAEVSAVLVSLLQAACDDILLGQLMSLSAWGQSPTSVPEVADETELDSSPSCFMRQPAAADLKARSLARGSLFSCSLADTQAEEDSKGYDAEFLERLKARLELVARNNAFRSAVDPLGALAFHALTPREQQALAEQEPSRMPQPRLYFFLRGSLFNHSEAPNASWLVAGGVLLVRAATPIKAGDEILVSYWPDLDAADAKAHGFLDSFGVDSLTAGCAPELELSPDQLDQLRRLKRAPTVAAETLASASAVGGDPMVLFDVAAATLDAEIVAAERLLGKGLRAFLEPRVFQAQLCLQQGAVATARGDSRRGEELRRLGLTRMRVAVRLFPQPWGKRVLLRLIFALKALLRPAPAALLDQDEQGAESGQQGEGSDFSVQLAAQAKVTVAELFGELELATEAVFGEKALLQAVLGKCGILYTDIE